MNKLELVSNLSRAQGLAESLANPIIPIEEARPGGVEEIAANVAELLSKSIPMVIEYDGVVKNWLWEIYVTAGGDPHGDDTFHCSVYRAFEITLQAVKELRSDYEEELFRP